MVSEHLAAKRAAVSDWRPIESAPRDGRPIIMGFVNDFSCEGYWMGNSSLNHWGETGWFAMDSDVLCEHPWNPTHWMPLPEPPK
jgi:hypothetical protein